MKLLTTISFLFIQVAVFAQQDVAKLTTSLKEFHKALVNKNTVAINLQTDKALSYGHSNGWVETKTDILKNLENDYISYHNFKEDSISIIINENRANARFVADITATLNGKKNTYHLKVLEVWIKKGNRWLLFARQAVRV